jgi:hypothetical protein
MARYYIKRIFDDRAPDKGCIPTLGLVSAAITATALALLLFVLTVLAAIGVVHRR